ncbi:MAG TPA: type II secretion system F family protein [Albitalea sp.]|uniref:type II secretion system F family protein n=1 Tax=Piscinibacter sp. TaxID=1903157 RepID=UPI002ED69758
MRIDLNRWWARTQLGAGQRLSLYRKIARMLSNGLPLLRVLEELHDRASDRGRKPNEAMAIVLQDWRRAVQNGRMLAEAIHEWVPSSEHMIILAGEQSGRLESALESVVGVVVAARRIRFAVVGGLAYPAAIVAMINLYVYLFGTRVIPEFARVVDAERWHGVARSLYLMSGFVRDWMPLLVLAMIAVVALVLASMPRWRGRLRVWLDRHPPFSVYRLVTGASFLMSFSALQSAGITVEKSLARLQEGAGPWLRERLQGALIGVKSGLNCGEALRNSGYGFPSQQIVDDMCVYAQYRGFSEALRMIADEWIEEGVQVISAQMRLVNALCIVALAVVIGWLVAGFFGIQQEIATATRSMSIR